VTETIKSLPIISIGLGVSNPNTQSITIDWHGDSRSVKLQDIINCANGDQSSIDYVCGEESIAIENMARIIVQLLKGLDAI